MPIQPPNSPRDKVDRRLACMAAIQLNVRLVVAEAVAAGWAEDEVLYALMALAGNYRFLAGRDFTV